jgi:uncharacterized surface protein with fasciclin (FAS1) repeats
MDQTFLTKLLTDPFIHHLEDLLENHAVVGKLMAADIVDGSFRFTLGSGFIDFAKSMDGTITINGLATVITADVQASNGVIHVIDQVLLPDWAASTAYQLLSEDSDLSTLVSLIDSAGLADTLNGPGPLTIFAPNNAAFAAALAADPTLDTISILQRHVVAGVVTTDDIGSGIVPSSSALSGELLRFLLINEGFVTVNGARVGGSSQLANNGVIHVLDEVILEQASSLPTITDIIVDGADFSTLKTAVASLEGLPQILQTNEYTVFAPNNAAFAAINQDLLTRLLTPPFRDHLLDLIAYHVMSGTVTAADIIYGLLKMVTEEIKEDGDWRENVGKGLMIVGGVAAVGCAIPAIAGFGAAGIVGGSVAAACQATIGNVAAGSAFAVLQSAGAAGVFTTGMIAGGAAAVAGKATNMLGKHENDKKKRENEDDGEEADDDKQEDNDGNYERCYYCDSMLLPQLAQ